MVYLCIQEELKNDFGEWLAVLAVKTKERNLDKANIYGLWGKKENQRDTTIVIIKTILNIYALFIVHKALNFMYFHN